MHLNKDTINQLFHQLQDEFDIEEPNAGHQHRFIQKLNAQSNGESSRIPSISKKTHWWKPLSIAASMAVLISLGIGFFVNRSQQINEIAPELEKTQFYFASLIEQEMEKINSEATPDTKQIVDDAMIQMDKLELNYQQLEKDLSANGNTKQILHAMIINFQTRIALLQNVLEKIENVKQLKSFKDEIGHDKLLIETKMIQTATRSQGTI